MCSRVVWLLLLVCAACNVVGTVAWFPAGQQRLLSQLDYRQQLQNDRGAYTRYLLDHPKQWTACTLLPGLILACAGLAHLLM
jgi:hypothetical protein